jgi:D-sedoheptulose 7-phosphate isomerase
MLESRQIKDAADLLEKISKDKELEKTIQDVIEICFTALYNGHRIWWAGNGGSAAEAQHLAAELSGKFKIDREALPSEALHVNSSYLTATSNDYGFQYTFQRLVEGIIEQGDILFVFTTSGKSKNIILAAKAAKKKKIAVVALAGLYIEELKKYSDFVISVPTSDTAHIQEVHLVIGHIICGEVESRLFRNNE